MNANKRYDVFISHFETSGGRFAKTIKNAFAEKKYQAFVSTTDKMFLTGNFKNEIDHIIKNCRIFVLLLTYGTLDRDEVVREVMVAKKSGKFAKNTVWVFRQNINSIQRTSVQFEKKTNIKLDDISQIDFEFEDELYTRALIKYDDEISSDTLTLHPAPKTKFVFDYIHQLIELYEKKGYRGVHTPNLGGGLRADLTLHNEEETIVYEIQPKAKNTVKELVKLESYRQQLKDTGSNTKIRLVLAAMRGFFNIDFKKNAARFNIELLDENNLDKRYSTD